MTGVDTITKRQAACIKGLSTRIGRPIPTGLDAMCRHEASVHIESLLGTLQNKSTSKQANTSKQRQLRVGNGLASHAGSLGTCERIRLGLAVKLVHHRWSATGKVVLGSRTEFLEEVVQLYGLLIEVEEEVGKATSY